MNVVVVYDIANMNGGAATVAITEAIALAQMQHHVIYFAGVGPVESLLLKNGVEVVCLDEKMLNEQMGSFGGKIRGMVQGVLNKKVINTFAQVLAQLDPKDTIVHIHGWSMALSPALFAVLNKTEFQTVITCHDYELICPNHFLYLHPQRAICSHRPMSAACLCTNCDRRSYTHKIYRYLRQRFTWRVLDKKHLSLIYVSAFSREILEKYLPFQCPSVTITNPVDLENPRFTTPERCSRYIFIGRLGGWKGARLFCEAVTRAGVQADVIGNDVKDGTEFETLRREYPDINFTGQLTHQQMLPYILQARCMIMPSTLYETGPLTVPEVQIPYALPCIVADKCGVSKTVADYETGLLFETGNLEQLVNCIEQCKDDELIKTFSKNCRENYHVEDYSMGVHINKLIMFYEKLLHE